MHLRAAAARGEPPRRVAGVRVDVERLEATLRVLASGRRLALLALLRSPRTLEELRLAPGPERAGARPLRPLSRQAVQGHLDLLLAEGLVRHRRRANGRGPREYYVDAARLFAVVEELRRVRPPLAALPVDPFLTNGLAEPPVPAEPAEGPRLVLVHGIPEGRAFPLREAALRPERGWVLGRSSSAAVGLGYDPYVSMEHAEVVRVPGGFALLPLRSAKNPTLLNFARATPGREAPLRTGDVIGLGRSRLVFRAE